MCSTASTGCGPRRCRRRATAASRSGRAGFAPSSFSGLTPAAETIDSSRPARGKARTGKVDPVDWVERIPFDETRDYVERVSENLGVYRARLAAEPVAPTQAAIARAAD
jgi:soluble lytic murein transglycosylase-like protein